MAVYEIHRTAVRRLPERRSSQVEEDASLVWGNCRAYNNRPSDQPVRDMCSEVEEEFAKLWAKAGLGQHKLPAEPLPTDLNEEIAEETLYTDIQEDNVPEHYNIFHGEFSDWEVYPSLHLESFRRVYPEF